MLRLRATPSATAVVAGEQDGAQAHACERLDGAPGFGTHGIGDGNRAEQPAVAGDKNLRCLQPDGQGRRHRDFALHHKRTVPHQDRRPADHRGNPPARCVIEPLRLKDRAALRPGVGHYCLAERVLGSYFRGGGVLEDRLG